MSSFDHVLLKAPPTMAEGAYRFFAYVAVLLWTPALISFGVRMSGKPLMPLFEFALEAYRWPIVAALTALRDCAASVTQFIYAPWMEFVTKAAPDAMLSAYAGGAYVASWNAARFQRARGAVVATIGLIALTLFFGVTLLGIAFLAIAYLAYAHEFGPPLRGFPEESIPGEGHPNSAYVLAPLLFPPAIALVLVVGNVLLSWLLFAT